MVFEFKNPANDVADTHAAYEQVAMRYARDIPRLMSYNAFTILSDGVNSKYGSIYAPYKFFNTWRQVEEGDEETQGVEAFYTLIEGLLRKDRLLALVKNFIFFPDALQQDDETKIIARPPQFFAATKLHHSIKLHMKPHGDGKGGTYFGTTGCGKSYTMLFLTRMLMRDPEMESPTILLITDRHRPGRPARWAVHVCQGVHRRQRRRSNRVTREAEGATRWQAERRRIPDDHPEVHRRAVASERPH